LFTDYHSILARWRKLFSQPLNVHGVNYVRQAEMHTAELLVPEPSAFEFELDIGKLKVTVHLVLLKSQQKILRQGVGNFAI